MSCEPEDEPLAAVRGRAGVGETGDVAVAGGAEGRGGE